jgi:hypothetical protein
VTEEVGPLAFVVIVIVAVAGFVVGLVLLILAVVVPCLVALGVLAANDRAERNRRAAERDDPW